METVTDNIGNKFRIPSRRINAATRYATPPVGLSGDANSPAAATNWAKAFPASAFAHKILAGTPYSSLTTSQAPVAAGAPDDSFHLTLGSSAPMLPSIPPAGMWSTLNLGNPTSAPGVSLQSLANLNPSHLEQWQGAPSAPVGAFAGASSRTSSNVPGLGTLFSSNVAGGTIRSLTSKYGHGSAFVPNT